MNNFIHLEFLQNISVCDLLINYHNLSKSKKQGTVYTSKGPEVVFDRKNSIDTTLFPGEEANLYLNELKKVANNYIKKYEYCNFYAPWTVIERINIQYYPPNGGYYQWHTERGSSQSIINDRHLVFMTYLNDVNDGGETEWYYQKLKIKPQKGLTVIWPADWTHTHRGIASATESKYIVTGWFSYYEENKK
jgi:hypothetical protein